MNSSERPIKDLFQHSHQSSGTISACSAVSKANGTVDPAFGVHFYTSIPNTTYHAGCCQHQPEHYTNYQKAGALTTTWKQLFFCKPIGFSFFLRYAHSATPPPPPLPSPTPHRPICELSLVIPKILHVIGGLLSANRCEKSQAFLNNFRIWSSGKRGASKQPAGRCNFVRQSPSTGRGQAFVQLVGLGRGCTSSEVPSTLHCLRFVGIQREGIKSFYC